MSTCCSMYLAVKGSSSVPLKHLRCSVPISRLAIMPRVIDRNAYRRGCGGWRMLMMSIGACLPCIPNRTTSARPAVKAKMLTGDKLDWCKRTPGDGCSLLALMTACSAVGRSHMPVLADRALPEPAGSSAMGIRAAACQSGRLSMPCSTACYSTPRRGTSVCFIRFNVRLHATACLARFATLNTCARTWRFCAHEAGSSSAARSSVACRRLVCAHQHQ
jgi:hypothetical protein